MHKSGVASVVVQIVPAATLNHPPAILTQAATLKVNQKKLVAQQSFRRELRNLTSWWSRKRVMLLVQLMPTVLLIMWDSAKRTMSPSLHQKRGKTQNPIGKSPQKSSCEQPF
uniref:Gte102 n=1 Tax=Arundo donax TaxID=35708 RepID=A0A0A9CNT7_ARUDO